jgi:hypothetical protein
VLGAVEEMKMKRILGSLFLIALNSVMVSAQVPAAIEAELRKIGQIVAPACTAKLYRPLMPMND